MQTISFSQSKTQQLEDLFNVKRSLNIKELENLLAINQGEIPTENNVFFTNLSEIAFLNIDSWTEQELIMKHISQIIHLVKYSYIDYNTFADRPFSYKFDKLKLSGSMDFLIAGGRSEPKAPYFCLHEYKKEQNFEADPKGKLLAEMLVAQALNRDAKTGFETIYGCYIVGRNWFWVILKDKEYAVSRAYDSTRIGDLSEIYLILIKIKYIIEDHIAAQKLKNEKF